MKLKNVVKMVFLAASLVALPAVYHMQNHGIIPDRLRYSRTLTGTRGPFDGSRIQKQIIRYIVDICCVKTLCFTVIQTKGPTLSNAF